MPHDEDRHFRLAELGARCLVARGLHQDRKTVVGIATERYEEWKGFSFDLVYFYIDNWGDAEEKQVKYLQTEFGYFLTPSQKSAHEDEYPIT